MSKKKEKEIDKLFSEIEGKRNVLKEIDLTVHTLFTVIKTLDGLITHVPTKCFYDVTKATDMLSGALRKMLDMKDELEMEIMNLRAKIKDEMKKIERGEHA